MPSKKAIVTTGFLESLDSAVAENQAVITAAGLDVAMLRTRLSTSKTAVVSTDTAKDSAYRVAEQATSTADLAEQNGYDNGSSVAGDPLAGGPWLARSAKNRRWDSRFWPSVPTPTNAARARPPRRLLNMSQRLLVRSRG